MLSTKSRARERGRTAGILIPSELYLRTVGTRIYIYIYIYICIYIYITFAPHSRKGWNWNMFMLCQSVFALFACFAVLLIVGRFVKLGWIRNNCTLPNAIHFLRFLLLFDFWLARQKCVLNIGVRMRSAGVWTHMGAYRCVMDAYECIRMHTDTYGCIWMHMDAY